MEMNVHHAKGVSVLNARIAADVREQLERWAAQNVSSMTTEVNRSVRERAAAEREREKAAG